MTKIIKIKVENLKAISNQEINLNGCSVIVTGANNSGKSTLLKSIIERIQSKKPELIVKQGESNGFAEMELSDGCKIHWKFTEKSEQLIFTTKEGFQIKTKVIETLQEKYFDNKKTFDIDKFLNQSPKEQQKALCLLLGIDFTEIDNEYKKYYDLRTAANSELKSLLAAKKEMPLQVGKPEIEDLKTKRAKLISDIAEKELKIKIENKKIREKWENENEKLRNEIESFNDEQKNKIEKINRYLSELEQIKKALRIFENYFNLEAANETISKLPKPESLKQFLRLPEPKYLNEAIDKSELIEIEKQIEAANEQITKYALFERDLKEYNEWFENGKKAREKANNLDFKVKEIENKKAQIIASAKMPEGFQFTEDGLLYNGFELNKNAQSTSSIYIAGLKLATMNLGELKAVHFDASFLDKNSLLEVEKYANSIDLQLLIERPDFDGGEIKYQIIQTL